MSGPRCLHCLSFLSQYATHCPTCKQRVGEVAKRRAAARSGLLVFGLVIAPVVGASALLYARRLLHTR